jgi:hypothetical protein
MDDLEKQIFDVKKKLLNDYFKQFEKPISLEDRKKLSPDCIRACLENPVIINKFEPKS